MTRVGMVLQTHVPLAGEPPFVSHRRDLDDDFFVEGSLRARSTAKEQ